MRTISKEELEKILENHKEWLRDGRFGSDELYADLRGIDLCGARLRNVDLREANLRRTNLKEADLREANLREANLHKANLMGAILSGANLFGANLRGANLIGADLTGANLSKAILPNPEVMNSICPLNCPETGGFIGWKKAYVVERVYPSKVWKKVEVIIKLQIPARAKRSSGTSRKCRCDRALVLDIQSLGGESFPKGTIAYSRYNPTFTYEVGQKLSVINFDNDRWKECSAGIHFFITRQEAVDY